MFNTITKRLRVFDSTFDVNNLPSAQKVWRPTKDKVMYWANQGMLMGSGGVNYKPNGTDALRVVDGIMTGSGFDLGANSGGTYTEIIKSALPPPQDVFGIQLDIFDFTWSDPSWYDSLINPVKTKYPNLPLTTYGGDYFGLKDDEILKKIPLNNDTIASATQHRALNWSWIKNIWGIVLIIYLDNPASDLNSVQKLYWQNYVSLTRKVYPDKKLICQIAQGRNDGSGYLTVPICHQYAMWIKSFGPDAVIIWGDHAFNGDLLKEFGL